MMNIAYTVCYNPEVAGLLLWFVSSSTTESEPFSLALKGQTGEPISSQQGALATNQTPKRVHYLLLLIKGPFWSRLITSRLPYSISLPPPFKLRCPSDLFLYT